CKRRRPWLMALVGLDPGLRRDDAEGAVCSAPRFAHLKKIAWLCVIALIFAQMPIIALRAQEAGGGDQPTFIRDAEIENYLHELAAPIYRAADIDPRSVTIVIVQSSVINAFVAEGMNEFFYTGLLQLADSPEQLVGVIAHETGHIAGGHLIRGQEEMRNASAETILGMILAVAAGVAAGNGGLAAGGLAGSQQMAMRSYLTFSRSVEASADSAGMSFLDKAGISARGMLEFFQKLGSQEMLPASRQAEYVQTHPLTQDRIDAVQQHLDNSPLKDARLPEKYYVMHERMKAKLLGYLQPETALLRYTDSDTRITARYARAIALYRTGEADHAIALTDGLIKQEPQNPFFYELKAQIQFDNGRIEDSITNYKKANDLLPDSTLLRQAYGHALLESKESGRLDLAIQQLVESNRLEEHTPMTWRFLAQAWGRKAEETGDVQYQATATYALAEEAAAKGNSKAAGQMAARAMKGLRKGSPYWLRAQDIKLEADQARQDEKDK
ncbi:MAG: M48 family metalloprotease, partial [Alphaproteobacteria bacterium]|nr:M48 family metalloprotease [Alphaproteobacteria bacterium]